MAAINVEEDSLYYTDYRLAEMVLNASCIPHTSYIVLALNAWDADMVSLKIMSVIREHNLYYWRSYGMLGYYYDRFEIRHESGFTSEIVVASRRHNRAKIVGRYDGALIRYNLEPYAKNEYANGRSSTIKLLKEGVYTGSLLALDDIDSGAINMSLILDF